MKPKILGIGFLLLALAGIESCGPNGDLALNTVTDSEYEAIKELRTGQYTLTSNKELSDLKHEAELGRGVGRYQIHMEGFRTWRLDTATGQICLLLTSEQDWKSPKVAGQGCIQ